MTFGMKINYKVSHCRYPNQRWKKFEDMFIRFDRIHERDRQTDERMDGRTPHDGIRRAYA